MDPIDIQKIPIMVWKADEAPKAYQELLDDLSDVDWIAAVPPDYLQDRPPLWLECGPFNAFGRPHSVVLPDGFVVYFGAH